MAITEQTQPQVASNAKIDPKAQKPKVLKDVRPKDAVLQPIPEGEKAQRTVTHIGNRKLRVLYSVSPSKDDKRRFQMDQTFDFSNVTDEEFAELAISTVVIDWQSHFRNMPDAERLNPATWQPVVDVKRDILSRQRQAASGRMGEVRSLMREMGLTDEQVFELIRKSQSKK